MVTLVIVVENVVFNHGNQFFSVGETFAVVTFSFQNAPETFHWTVVNALADAGHALGHAGSHEHAVKSVVGVLETAVAVEQRACIRIQPNCFIEVFKHKRIIVAVANVESNNSPVIKVQDGTKINLVDGETLIVLELRHVGQPLLVRCFCLELPCKNILGVCRSRKHGILVSESH